MLLLREAYLMNAILVKQRSLHMEEIIDRLFDLLSIIHLNEDEKEILADIKKEYFEAKDDMSLITCPVCNKPFKINI